MKFRKSLTLTVGGVLTLGMLAVGISPASANTSLASDSLEQLAMAGLYQPGANAGQIVGSAATGEKGLTLDGPTAASKVTVKPVGNLPSTEKPGAVVYKGQSNDFSYVMTDATAGKTAGYSVINNASAPSTYAYEIKVGDKPAVLSVAPGGAVQVADASGAMINRIAPAWAKDANGVSLSTSYRISGNVLIQDVDLSNAAFPVIADPRLQKDWLNNTIEFSRSETATAASSDGAFVAVCAPVAFWFPPVGAVCGAFAGAASITAKQAQNQGDCLGIRWGNGFPVPTYPYPVIVGCYA